MRTIVFIHLFNDRSGSPKVLSQTIKALQKKGFKTELITSGHKDGFLVKTGDIQHTLFYRRSENKFITLFYYLISQILLFFQCLRYKNKNVVFYINTMMPFGAALAGKLMRKKVYWHIHETSIKPRLLKQFLRFIISIVANKIIFVSQYLREAENFKNKDQIVIYNALDLNMRTSKLEKKSYGDFSVLMICSLKKYKGLLEFLQLANFMEEEKNLHFVLVLNASSKEIDDYFYNIDIPVNVTIHARQSEIGVFYKQADLLLNLSRPDECIESFGLTIIEGMSNGLPVIVPPIGGPSEIVRENKEGFLISCYEIETIRERIIFLMNNESEYKRLSVNALTRSKDFTQVEFERSICAVFEDIK